MRLQIIVIICGDWAGGCDKNIRNKSFGSPTINRSLGFIYQTAESGDFNY